MVNHFLARLTFLLALSLVAFSFLGTDMAIAQPTNRDVIVSLVGNCVSNTIASDSSVAYSYSGSTGFIESGVVAAWLSEGKSVRVHDNASKEKHLEFQTTNIAVQYRRSSRSTVDREVSVSTIGTVRDADGTIIESIDCPDSFRDTVDRHQLDSIEDSEIPLTQGTRPSRGFVRKYLQPVVVAAASAVTVYLFFSIRSNDSGSSS